MAENHLTQDQYSAMMADDKRILVSAAAGSGKTHVLIQRVLRLLRQNVPLKRMLIITYTNAAAAELRERLSQKLTENLALEPEAYGQALNDLEESHISTIHTYGASLLREFFHRVDIDPSGKVAPDSQSRALLEQAWRDAMNDLLQGHDPDFMLLSDAYDNKTLNDMSGRLHEFLMSLDHPLDWMERMIAETEKRPFSETIWYKALAKQLMLKLERVRLTAERVLVL